MINVAIRFLTGFIIGRQLGLMLLYILGNMKEPDWLTWIPTIVVSILAVTDICLEFEKRYEP